MSKKGRRPSRRLRFAITGALLTTPAAALGAGMGCDQSRIYTNDVPTVDDSPRGASTEMRDEQAESQGIEMDDLVPNAETINEPLEPDEIDTNEPANAELRVVSEEEAAQGGPPRRLPPQRSRRPRRFAPNPGPAQAGPSGDRD